MRDGRAVYVGRDRVEDVTTHPAFRRAARTVADLYDYKRQPELRDALSFEENGERFSIYFLRAKTREDLRRRTKGHKLIADRTLGMFGRSPDHVAGLITGMAMNPKVLNGGGEQFGANLLNYYERARREDLYCGFACVPPTGARGGEFMTGQRAVYPALRVVDERDDGLVLSGIKMLATGAIFADELWIGNLIPLDEKLKSEAITCAFPINTTGVSLWSRQTVEDKVEREADYPLSFRLDETDSILICDNVFLHNDTAMSRAM
jgi:4-hydroxyphenylacetate 3-monooxygenase